MRIDRSLVQELGEISESEIFIFKITNLAQSLSIQTVAEGVENAEQLRWLKEMGCDIAQDYYFAEPQPSEEIGAKLGEGHGW